MSQASDQNFEIGRNILTSTKSAVPLKLFCFRMLEKRSMQLLFQEYLPVLMYHNRVMEVTPACNSHELNVTVLCLVPHWFLQRAWVTLCDTPLMGSKNFFYL